MELESDEMKKTRFASVIVPFLPESCAGLSTALGYRIALASRFPAVSTSFRSPYKNYSYGRYRFNAGSSCEDLSVRLQSPLRLHDRRSTFVQIR